MNHQLTAIAGDLGVFAQALKEGGHLLAGVTVAQAARLLIAAAGQLVEDAEHGPIPSPRELLSDAGRAELRVVRVGGRPVEEAAA